MSIEIDVPHDEFTRKRIRDRIDASIAEIRSTGAAVSIVHDLVIAVVVLVEPLPSGRPDCESWGELRAPTEMLIDPHDYLASKMRALRAAADHAS
jgi:hypothetical protein